MPPKSTKIERVCQQCGTVFFVHPYTLLREGGGTYCSRNCASLGRRYDPVAWFWSHIEKTESCWLWTGSTVSGYGTILVDRKVTMAHRFAYQLLVGPIPDGYELDHVRTRGCTHRNCVNPAHLEPVTHRINCLRSDSPPAVNAQKTHCKHGHEFTPENTYMFRGYRYCRACNKRHAHTYHHTVRKISS